MDVDVYSACDRAIKEMNRQNLRAFGQLKLKKGTEAGLIREVQSVYWESAKRARRYYLEIAVEAYILGLMMCGTDAARAHRMADEAIDYEWIDRVLTTADPVTMYRFDTETDRKAQRLTETLAALADGAIQAGKPATNADLEIDKALKAWSKMLGQYAINVTDYAMIQAFRDAGEEGAFWRAKKDISTCSVCKKLNGQWFPLDGIPKKHWACRCRLEPGNRPE